MVCTYLVKKTPYNKDIIEAGAIEIDGNGVVFKGRVRYADPSYTAKVEMYMDGKLVETANLPADSNRKDYRPTLFWKYQIPKGKHTFTFKWLNPVPKVSVYLAETLTYSDAPVVPSHQ